MDHPLVGRRRAWVALMAASMLVSGVGVASARPTGDGPGNSRNAMRCNNGGWEELERSDGTDFANQGECVAYAARGGEPQPRSDDRGAPACGDEIVEDLTLSADLGPCPGHGLIIAADGVTLDLDGHHIIGDPVARSTGELDPMGTRDRAGVLLRRVSNATVAGGTVRGFDAGVAIMGGGANTVHGMEVRDNINYRILTGTDADPGPDTPSCLLGDGVASFNSSNNDLHDNALANNGPLSGVALVGNSDDNAIRNNRIVDTDVVNQTRDGDSRTTVCGVGENQGPSTRGQRVEAIGIRIEGPGAERNAVRTNTVERSAIVGIAIHGHPCASPNNGGNQILGNMVTRTGERTVALDPSADGIATLVPGRATDGCVAHSNTISENTSSNNLRDGISLGGRGSHSNVVNDNQVHGNARMGISVAGPADGLPGAIDNTLHRNTGHRNTVVDGADFNVACDNNDWQSSDFGTVNQACVRDRSST